MRYDNRLVSVQSSNFLGALARDLFIERARGRRYSKAGLVWHHDRKAKSEAAERFPAGEEEEEAVAGHGTAPDKGSGSRAGTLAGRNVN